jgi:hypothetical protein
MVLTQIDEVHDILDLNDPDDWDTFLSWIAAMREDHKEATEQRLASRDESVGQRTGD